MNTSTHTRTLLAALLTLTLTCVGGCSEDEPWEEPGPEGALRAFLLDWFMFRHEQAFERLSEADRGALAKGRAALIERVGEGSAPPVHEMLVGSAVASPYDLKKVERVDELEGPPKAGQSVRLKLEYLDGREAQATMIWSDGGWFVALGVGSRDAETE